MSEELIKSIKLLPSFLIVTHMGDAYIDEDYMAYLFFYRDDAKSFIKDKPNLKIQEASFRDEIELLTSCYLAGAFKIKLINEKKEQIANINETNLPLGFYNNSLNGNLALFIASKKKIYLQKMTEGKFIVPIRIKNNSAQEITYGVVKLNRDSDDFHYLAFTNLKEYEKWAAKAAGWQPLLVTYDIMCQISGERGYIINLFGNRLSLPYKLMEQFREK